MVGPQRCKLDIRAWGTMTRGAFRGTSWRTLKLKEAACPSIFVVCGLTSRLGFVLGVGLSVVSEGRLYTFSGTVGNAMVYVSAKSPRFRKRPSTSANTSSSYFTVFNFVHSNANSLTRLSAWSESLVSD
jgi:hypothetical protein